VPAPAQHVIVARDEDPAATAASQLLPIVQRIDKVGRRRHRQVEVQLVSRDDGDVDVPPTKRASRSSRSHTVSASSKGIRARDDGDAGDERALNVFGRGPPKKKMGRKATHRPARALAAAAVGQFAQDGDPHGVKRASTASAESVDAVDAATDEPAERRAVKRLEVPSAAAASAAAAPPAAALDAWTGGGKKTRKKRKIKIHKFTKNKNKNKKNNENKKQTKNKKYKKGKVIKKPKKTKRKY
jgi:hypothetical protein